MLNYTSLQGVNLNKEINSTIGMVSGETNP